MMKSLIPNDAVKRLSFALAVLAGLFVVTCLQTAKAQQSGSVASEARWLADIPLEDSLVVATELGFSFDSPSGRIIVLFATTDAPASAIRAYYRSVLPPLGWQGSGNLFRRGQEEVMIKQVKVNGLGLWRIALQPLR
ncbi:MAG: hypothetical protein QNL57_06155 [Alphaproteobacteria bacterium]|tara:strand:- start:32 stop:442 length:411 start_codon:yes stop_codon:yes gene_type:complete